MKKQVLLAFEGIEKTASVETKIISIQHTSNIDYLNRVVTGIYDNRDEDLTGWASPETFLLKTEIIVTIDHFTENLPYYIFLNRTGSLNDGFFDDSIDTPVIEYSCKKFILRQIGFEEINSKKQIPYLVQLIQLIEGRGIPVQISSEEFYNIDESSILVNFDSYKDFEYSLKIEKGEGGYNPSLKKIYKLDDLIYSHHLPYFLISFSPKRFINFYFKLFNGIEDFDSMKMKALKHKYKIDILKSGDYKSIEDIFINDKARDKLANKYAIEKARTYRRDEVLEREAIYRKWTNDALDG